MAPFPYSGLEGVTSNGTCSPWEPGFWSQEHVVLPSPSCFLSDIVGHKLSFSLCHGEELPEDDEDDEDHGAASRAKMVSKS